MEERKDQESIQSSTAPYGKVAKAQENVTYRSAVRSAVYQQVTTRLQDTDKAIVQRRTQINKDPQKKSGAYLHVRKNACAYHSAQPV